VTKSSIPKLLTDLDSPDRRTRKAAEGELAAMGDQAVDGILKSAHEINLTLLSASQEDTVIESLGRRIRLLGRSRSAQAIPMVSAALVDASELIHAQELKVERMKSALIPDSTYIVLATDRLSVAKKLRRTAVDALVQIGDAAERHLGDHLSAFSPIAQQAIHGALRTIRIRRFWRTLLRKR
jgi:hypothetical protein